MKAAKALIAFLTALGTWGATAFADNGLTIVEAFGLTGVLVAGILVYTIPNADYVAVKRDRKGKFIPKDEG